MCLELAYHKYSVLQACTFNTYETVTYVALSSCSCHCSCHVINFNLIPSCFENKEIERKNQFTSNNINVFQLHIFSIYLPSKQCH